MHGVREFCPVFACFVRAGHDARVPPLPPVRFSSFLPSPLTGLCRHQKGKKNVWDRDLVFLPFASRVVRATRTRGLWFFFVCFHVENSLKTVESWTGGRP
jgi:hypothetical protein